MVQRMGQRMEQGSGGVHGWGANMARKIGVLSALAVGRESNPGFYSDGGGLYLRVGPTGAKSWVDAHGFKNPRGAPKK